MGRRLGRRWEIAGLSIWGLLVLLAFLQLTIAHRQPIHQLHNTTLVDITGVLEKGELTKADYALLTTQTGLGREAIDRLWNEDRDRILETQEQYCSFLLVGCDSMVWRITCEDHLYTLGGEREYSPTLVDPRPGDILLSFSTHTFGWRHGHGGLIVETTDGLGVLESGVIGTRAKVYDLAHWQEYSNYYHLRVTGVGEEVGERVSDFAVDYLVGTPYCILAGLFTPTNPRSRGFVAQCFYLIWAAWNVFGVDLQVSSYPIVLGSDLMNSPYLKLVQRYG